MQNVFAKVKDEDRWTIPSQVVVIATAGPLAALAPDGPGLPLVWKVFLVGALLATLVLYAGREAWRRSGRPTGPIVASVIAGALLGFTPAVVLPAVAKIRWSLPVRFGLLAVIVVAVTVGAYRRLPTTAPGARAGRDADRPVAA